MKSSYFAWPGWSFLGFAGLLSALNGVWFFLIYNGCEWITAHRSLRVPIHLPWEISIPLVPGAVVAYMSIYLLFLAGPFIVRERRAFAAQIGALSLSILIGGVGFLLLPSTAAFPPAPADLGIWTDLFRLADRLNLDFNMVPSLHVALSVSCVSAFARRAPSWGRVLLWAWALAIAFSTVLTHQHHILDAVSGWIVGIFAQRVALRYSGAEDQRRMNLQILQTR